MLDHQEGAGDGELVAGPEVVVLSHQVHVSLHTVVPVVGRGVGVAVADVHWAAEFEEHLDSAAVEFHAGDAIDRYSTSDDCIRPLRYPAGYAMVLSLAFAIFINGLEKLASFYNAEMGQQVRNHAVRVLTPKLSHTADQIQKALRPAM